MFFDEAWFWKAYGYTLTATFAAVYASGLHVALRHRHLGAAAKFGAIGFGLLLAETIGGEIFQELLSRFVMPVSKRPPLLAYWLLGTYSCFTLLRIAGCVLIVLSLRRAMIEHRLNDSH